MSYSCTISFKQIKSEKLYPFLQSLKKEAEKIAPDVAKDEYIWSPIYRWMEYDEEKEKIIKSVLKMPKKKLNHSKKALKSIIKGLKVIYHMKREVILLMP